jgi:hypothetical protein
VLIRTVTAYTVKIRDSISHCLPIKVKQPAATRSDLTSPSLLSLLTSYKVWKYDKELFYYKTAHHTSVHKGNREEAIFTLQTVPRPVVVTHHTLDRTCSLSTHNLFWNTFSITSETSSKVFNWFVGIHYYWHSNSAGHRLNKNCVPHRCVRSKWNQ